eukprot:1567209-Amphidinium_carterae.1
MQSVFNASLGGVWHEVRSHSAFAVGGICVRCHEEVEDLSHIVFRCPQWHKKRHQDHVDLPADDDTVPPCVKLHGLLPAPRVPTVIQHETAQEPHHQRCGVGHYTDS